MALKILLADDSMIAQNLGKKILTDAGHEVIAVSNGAAAVKKIAETKPQLAILDIYMPGYTGLEVCERMKNAPETAKIPVLLTVGKMEPYRPEDGARVRAEGVIIKPFEGSDLIAAVNKLEEKLAQPKATPDYEKTVVLSPQEIQEFKDASYEEWKSETAEPAAAVPAHDMSLPAFGMEELPVESPAAPAITPVAAVAAAGAAASAMPAMSMSVAEAPVFAVEGMPAVEPIDPFAPTDTQPIEPLVEMPPVMEEIGLAPEVPVQLPEAPAPDALATFPAVESDAVAVPEFEPTAMQAVNFDASASSPMPELEFNAAPSIDIHVDAAPEFEPTILQDEIVVENLAAVDPALVTDVSEMATAFPTKFGVENAEDVPVGVFTEEIAAVEPIVMPEPFPAEETLADAGVMTEGVVGEQPVSDEEAAMMAMPAAVEPEMEPAAALEMDALPELEQFAPAMKDIMPEAAEPEIPHYAEVVSEAPVEPAVGWQAHEAAVEPGEADISLDEEMQRAFAALEEKLDTPVVPAPAAESHADIPLVEEVAAIAPELADAPVHVEEVVDTAPAPAISGDPELAAAMEAALASMDSQDVPETVIETAPVVEPAATVVEPVELDKTIEEAMPVSNADVASLVESVEVLPGDEFLLAPEAVASEVLPGAQAEPDLAAIETIAPVEFADFEEAQPPSETAAEPLIPKPQPEPLEQIESEVMRRAAIIEPAAAVVHDEVVAQQHAVDEGRVAAAVARVMERMKTQIVEEIVKELQSE